MKNQNNWPQVKLKNIAIKIIGGGTPPTSKAEYWNGEIAWTTSAHLTGREIQTGQKYITKKGLLESSTCIVPKQNILIATRVGIGKVAINKIDIAISQDLTGILIDKKIVMSEYLYWALTRKNNKLKALAQGSTIKGILRKDVAKIQIPLPPIPEQKKIAEILSTVDLAIEKANNAIKKNELILNGLLKYLFHNNIKNWGNETLNNLSNSIVGGGTPSTSKSEFWNGNIAWMTSAHISNRDIVDGQKYITKTGLEKSSSKLVIKNNIIIATRVGIGKVALNKIDVAINQDLTGIVLEHDKIVPDFLYYFFLTQKNKLKALAQGSTIKGILREDISKLNIPLPSLSIQRKIVAILNSFYEKQELLNKKKEKLTSIKKGLMNDLLTGRKRVRLES